MPVEDITKGAVREALRAVRYAKPLGANPLVSSAMITLRLQREGVEPTDSARAWQVGRLLDEVVGASLTRLRGNDGGAETDPVRGGRDADVALLRCDFRDGDIVREAWAMLHFRYLSGSLRQTSDVADELGVVPRTLQRRLSRGHGLLAAELRQLELEAAKELHGATPAAPAGARVGARSAFHGAGHNLPTSLTSFIGRSADVEGVTRLMNTGRLVTLVGPGGIGKTRLAIEVARLQLVDYLDGVWLAELEQVDSPDLVAEAVAKVLDVGEAPGTSIIAALTEALRTRRLLLVLDNCEHLIDAVAALVTEILRSGEDFDILATSREPLRVAGEVLWDVESLATPPQGTSAPAEALADVDSVRLFCERVRSRQPTFEITAQNARWVAEICRRLDGLPLAIELAAARAGTLPVREIVQRLENRFRFLTRGDRSALERHQTIRATVDWSYNLLEPAERVLFARLSAFSGGWSLEAAEAVCADGGADEEVTAGDAIDLHDVLDLLTALADKSLVVAPKPGDAAPRYRMLETLRAYGRERLEPDEASAVEARHAAYYAERAARGARRLHGARGERWLKRLDTDHDNLTAAIRWARAHDPTLGYRIAASVSEYWLRRGFLSVGRTLLAEVIDAGGDEDSTARAAALEAAGRLARQQSAFDAALVHLLAALEVRRSADDSAGAASTLRELGSVAEEQGNYEDADRWYAESLHLYEALDDNWGQAAVLNNLGITADHRGQHGVALEHLEASLARFEKIGDGWAEAVVQANLANVATNLGQMARARELYDASLATASDLGDRVGLAAVLSSRAYVHFREGNLGAARADLRASAEVLAEIGDSQKAADWAGTAALVLANTGDVEGAARMTGVEEAVREKIQAPAPMKQAAEGEELVKELRRRLGPEAVEELVAQGRGLPWREAMRTAFRQPDRELPAQHK